MSVTTRGIAVPAAVLIALSAAHGQGRIEEQGRARRFVSDKYGFSIAVPAGWLVDASRDTPIYFSFSPSQAGEFNHQLKLPKGGAVITVIAQEILPPRQPRTLSGWAAADARGASAEAPSAHSFEMPAASAITAALTSSYDTAVFGPDDQSQHCVNVFWEFRQRLFAAHLMYPAHDSKGPEFDKVFLGAVRSIRPLAGPGHAR